MSVACCNEMSFAQYLCIGEKENLRWIGTYEDLRDFMICFALPNAKWSSPGGDCKMIESDVVSIRWYASSGNLTIKGEKAAAFELKLKTILVCQAEETVIHVEGNIDRLLQDKHLLENEGHGSPIAESYTSDDESSNMHGNKSILDEFVHTLKLQVDSLTQKVSECQSNSEKIAKINVELEQLKGKDLNLNLLNNSKELEQLKHKNDELDRENISLREINANLTSTLTELNIKLKAIESERMSLVTVIKVLQSDQNLHEYGSGDPSTQTTAKWNTKTSEFEKQSQKTESSKLPPGENTIQLNNRFNALAVDESVHEVEPNVLSQGQISPLENPNLTNLLSTPYPSNPTTSKTRVLDNQTENDAEIGASAAQTDASKNLEGPIVIIGDSIIKDIIPEKLSRKPVKKYKFAGKTAEEISEQLDSIQLQENPSHVIIHAGTNNLRTDTAKTCATKIGKLVNHIKVKFPQSKVGISGLTIRKDCDVGEKLNQTNKDLRSFCIRQGHTFIDNANINSSALNSSKLHLNPKGTAYLAVNFINFLRNRVYSKRRNKQLSKQDFQNAQLLQLGKYLTTLAMTNPT